MQHFLENFFHISTFKSLIILISLGISFVILKSLKKNLNLSLSIFISLIFGFIFGFVLLLLANFPQSKIEDLAKIGNLLWLYEVHIWIDFLNSLYISMLKLVVIPLVFISLIYVLININNNVKISSLFSRAFFWLLFTTAISAIIGISLAMLTNLGVDMQDSITTTKALKEVKGLNEVILNLIPSNIISSMSDNNIIGVIIFAFIIAFGARSLREHRGFEGFSLIVEFLYNLISKVALYMINLMPYFIITMIADTLILNGFRAISDALSFIIILYLAFIALFIIYAILLLSHGLNPLIFFKKALPAMLMAFSSRSSSGTLPVTISTLTQKLGVSHGNASFIASLGTTMGMNGCAGYYAAMIAIFMLHALGINIGFSDIIIIVILCVITSFGIAGIPGITIMIISVILSGLGLQSHFALVAVILAIDPILDMARTCSNVVGAMIASILTDKELGSLDERVYKS